MRRTFGPGISPAFRSNDGRFKRTRPLERWQGFEEILARLGTQRLPVWTPQRREVLNEEVSEYV